MAITWSQNGADQRWRTSYQQAEENYAAATRMASSKAYDEGEEQRLNARALRCYQQAFSESRPGSKDVIRYRMAFRIGELQHYFERIDSALIYYRAAMDVQRTAQLPDSLLFKPLLYTGLIEYRRNRFDSALAMFTQAEELERRWQPAVLEESERLYNLQGVLHYEKGDYRQAGHYFRTALQKLDPAHAYYHDLFVNYQINLAQIHLQLDEYEEANRLLTGLQPRVQGLNASLVRQNLGLIHFNLGAPASALEQYRRVAFTGSRLVWLYNNIGEAHLQLRQKDSAQFYFERALDQYRELGKEVDQKAHGQTLKNLGDLHLDTDPLQAARYYQQALSYFYPAFRDTSVNDNPARYSGVFSYINLFKTLAGKAEALQKLYDRGKNQRWGDLALNTWRSAFALTAYVERTYNSDESRLFLGKIKYLVHGRPIDLAYQLYLLTGQAHYLGELYRYDQLNKASVLAFRQGTGSRNHSERDLRTRITRLSLQAANLRDSASIARISNEIREAELLLEKSAQGSKAVADDEIPALQQLQQDLLDNRTALLSFHLSDRRLTRVLLTRKTASVTQKELPGDFRDQLERYNRQLRSGEESPGDSLLTRLLIDSLPEAGRLIIIPDDELHYLSFESLRERNGKYLIENRSVQYQYSSLLLQKDEQDLQEHRTLALAPFAGRGSGDARFPALPHSGAEVQGLRGKILLDAAARKDSFLHSLKQYEVLHLATHAVAGEGDRSSFIAFAGEPALMYAGEIGDLQLSHTRLVVLSACETGTGELVRGEGLMSLSRSFAMAGCNNIITSLWKANDYSTTYLTRKLHEHLNKGLSIDAALRQAKLGYLSDPAINPRLKHPYYWSHLVFVGNYRPDERGKNFVWWIVGGGLLVLLGWTVWRNR